MLHQPHFGHQISSRHERVRRIATRNYHVGALRPRAERGEHLLDVQPAEAQAVRELVEDQYVVLAAFERSAGSSSMLSESQVKPSPSGTISTPSRSAAMCSP